MLKCCAVTAAVLAVVRGQTTSSTEFPFADETCESGDEFFVDYQGSSGQFELISCTDEDRYMRVKINDLTEYSEGTKTNNKLTSFTNGDWEYSRRVEYDANADAAYNEYTYSENGVTLKIGTWMFYGDTEISVERENGSIAKYGVEEGNVKFSVDITGWAFEDDANDLRLTMTIRSGKGGGEAKEEESGEDEDEDESTEEEEEDTDVRKRRLADTDSDSERKTVSFGDDYRIVNIKTATIDDSQIDIEVDGPNDKNGNQATITYIFPSFADYVEYDPVVTVDSEDAAADHFDSFLFIGGTLFFAFFHLL